MVWDDSEPPDWGQGPEAQMWSEQAKWESRCASEIDRLWRSLPPIAYPNRPVYPFLFRWSVIKILAAKRWR